MHQVFIQDPATPCNPTKQNIEAAIVYVSTSAMPWNMHGVSSTDDMKADANFILSFCREVGEAIACVPNGNFECDAARQGMSTRGILAEFGNALDTHLRIAGNLCGITYEVFATALWDSYIDNWHKPASHYILTATKALQAHTQQGNVSVAGGASPMPTSRTHTSVPTFSAQYGAQPAPSTSHKSTPAGSGRDTNAEVLALAIEGVNKTAPEFSQTAAVKNLNKIIDLLEGK